MHFLSGSKLLTCIKSLKSEYEDQPYEPKILILVKQDSFAKYDVSIKPGIKLTYHKNRRLLKGTDNHPHNGINKNYQDLNLA